MVFVAWCHDALDPCMNKVKGNWFGYFLDPSIGSIFCKRSSLCSQTFPRFRTLHLAYPKLVGTPCITWTLGIKHPATAWKWCIEAQSKQSKDGKSLEKKKKGKAELKGLKLWKCSNCMHLFMCISSVHTINLDRRAPSFDLLNKKVE